ncbi:retrovirus-related pol polyprotein from transposon TNT 1-94, partial [Tanacetum coccineum]
MAVCKVAKLGTVKVLIAIATAKGLPLHQLDVNNAFLHGHIDEEIYMKPPNGYPNFLVHLGFVQSKHDYSMFVKHNGDEFTVALFYVDDVLLTGNSPTVISQTKVVLDAKFTIKDLGLAKYFLGIEIASLTQGTYLTQRKYILDLLHDAGLTASKPVNSPLPPKLKLTLGKGPSMSAPDKYRRFVGRLLYMTMTRPDVSYDVLHLSQFVSCPTDSHMQTAIHHLKYLKGTISKGVFYPVQPLLKVTGFSDADWASCLMTRKSLTGYC